MAGANTPEPESSGHGGRCDFLNRCSKLKKIHFWRHVGDFTRNTAFTPKNPVGKDLFSPKKDFCGKTIVMIGATSDIGAEAAIKFAQLNVVNLILGVRDVQKGNALK